jgi:two-component system osmolarity sensor histidine kinase EnvZ
MQHKQSHWLQREFFSGLFWRTFLLLSLLITISMVTWFVSFKVFERKPRAQQLSAQVTSIVTITRAALTHSNPNYRAQLLYELANNEGIRIYLLEEQDSIIEPESTPVFKEIKRILRQSLGSRTKFAQSVNGVSGFWISFEIEQDAYWLRLDSDRIEPDSGLQIISWASLSILFALIVAVLISRHINAPLSALSERAKQIANGQKFTPLPETGPKEIRRTNTSFNQMVEDLTRAESDRAVILAGISHDLRTPITRLHLEIEMAPLDEVVRQEMVMDLQQMDNIISQFLDYAKPLDAINMSEINLSNLLHQLIEQNQRTNSIHIQANIESDLCINGNSIELKRLFSNLIENAKRYGLTPNSNQLQLEITCIAIKDSSAHHRVEICMRDHGTGVAVDDIPRLIKPFTRVDIARSQANGAGLGLAIVDRIIQRHGGNLILANHSEGGLLVKIRF